MAGAAHAAAAAAAITMTAAHRARRIELTRE
jgi:hypothetical protein